MVAPFFGAATAAQLGNLVRQGFATVLLMADPVVEIQLYRLNESTGEWDATGSSTEVALRYGSRAADTITDTSELGAISQTLAFGDVRSWAPWDVAIGDTFVLSDGRVGRVVLVPPERYGIQQADFTIDEGSSS